MSEVQGSPFKSGYKENKAPKVVLTLEGVVCTNPGDHIAPVYKRVYDEKLDRNIVKKVDETNLFEFIQASKSTTDLATLQKRFIEFGEIPNVDPSLVYDESPASALAILISLISSKRTSETRTQKIGAITSS